MGPSVVPGAPVITITGQSANRISAVSGKDYCQITFAASKDLAEWEARATASNEGRGRGSGLLVGSGTLLPAGEAGAFYVYASQLTNGDRTYTIAVYGCDEEGNWSDCVVWLDSAGRMFATADGEILCCQREEPGQQSFSSAYTAEQLAEMVLQGVVG